MHDLLPAPPELRELQADGPVAVFLDFDGTLVEIAATPDGIEIPRNLVPQLAELAKRLEHRLALVSGRSIANLIAHLGPVGLAVAGSHGADRRLGSGEALGETPRPLPQTVRRELAAFAAREGFVLEDKPHGAALHYRDRPGSEAGGERFVARLADAHDLAVKRGKAVFEIVRPGADKGGAVRAFMEVAPFAGARPVFIGDDVTDEDGFLAVRESGGHAILVGDRRPTAATFALADPAAVHAWLGL